MFISVHCIYQVAPLLGPSGLSDVLHFKETLLVIFIGNFLCALKAICLLSCSISLNFEIILGPDFNVFKPWN
jgi:hypothetical protein